MSALPCEWFSHGLPAVQLVTYSAVAPSRKACTFKPTNAVCTYVYPPSFWSVCCQLNVYVRMWLLTTSCYWWLPLPFRVQLQIEEYRTSADVATRSGLARKIYDSYIMPDRLVNESVSLIISYVCTNVCMYVCMHVRTYACMHACMYVCIYVCMYVCMYVCTFICIVHTNYPCRDPIFWICTCSEGDVHTCVTTPTPPPPFSLPFSLQTLDEDSMRKLNETLAAKKYPTNLFEVRLTWLDWALRDGQGWCTFTREV